MDVVRRTPPADDVLTWEPSERWVRGVKGEVTVVDSRRPILVWEPGRRVPLYAFPESDVDVSALRPAVNPAVDAHPGTEFFDLAVGGHVTENVAWRLPGAELGGHLAFGWFRPGQGGLDHWYEEEEEIFVHPRDPYHRVDPLHSTRHVVVEVGGLVLADTHAPILLFETRLPTRFYIPPADVRFELLERTELHTACPYKGKADYWSVRGDTEAPPNIAWAYPDPIPASRVIKDHVAFYNEAVDLVVDGERLGRPVTLFNNWIAAAAAGATAPRHGV
jgi:uncharacterized protein (DUF427 family)